MHLTNLSMNFQINMIIYNLKYLILIILNLILLLKIMHIFDIIVANDVVHDTTNLHNTFKNITKIMRPNSILIMNETVTNIFWNMCFGRLLGFDSYKNDETDIRNKINKNNHTLLKGQWTEILKEHFNLILSNVIPEGAIHYHNVFICMLQDSISTNIERVYNCKETRVIVEHNNQIKNSLCELLFDITGIENIDPSIANMIDSLQDHLKNEIEKFGIEYRFLFTRKPIDK